MAVKVRKFCFWAHYFELCWTRLPEMLSHSWVLSHLPFNCTYALELTFILTLGKVYSHRAISMVLTDLY